MPRRILIDGYNLLFAIGRGPSTVDRQYLLDLLARYRARRNVDITVVFDRKTGDISEPKQILLQQGVRIIFSAPSQEADEIIRHSVEGAHNPKDILVVSSDKAGVSKYCKKLGAAVADSKVFFDFLTKSGPHDASEEWEEKPAPSREDTNYYLKKFTEGQRS